jgi:dihydropteroate synthase
MIFKAREFEFDLSKRPYIIGIVNITPDSFFDGGCFLDPEDAIAHAKKLVRQGADILDLGAESTRPQAEPISATEEKRRLLPVIKKLVKELSVPLSIDTMKADVAREALQCGAHIINDISGLKADPRMAAVVREFDAACILMHMRGTPQTMQQHVTYDDLIEDIIRELGESILIACKQGISRRAIIVDPGIGFSKTAEQNNEILRRLADFGRLDMPLLVGPSRKSFIGKIVQKEEPHARVFGTAAAIALAVERGARFIRVHDVAEMKDVVLVTDAIMKQGI